LQAHCAQNISKMIKLKDNERKGLHVHRITPILFSGSPTDKQNVIFVTRFQHAEYATFWNRKVKEIHSLTNEVTAHSLTDSLNTASLEPVSAIESVERFFNIKLPSDYKEFLQVTNGLEGETADNYLVLWSAEELVKLNQAYHVNEFVSNILIIGSDGAEEAFAFDTTDMTIVQFPFIGMGHIPDEKLFDTFSDFLSSQIKEEK
jgi:hypothetical protein